MAINTFVSDIFFNMDFSDAFIGDPGDRVISHDVMLTIADNFLDCLREVSREVDSVTSEELVQDFYDRT